MINNVTLVGRLTKDPDLRYISNGKGVASFTLAVNRNFTNQAGEREADFINCVIWGKPAETLANYARKGTLLGVTGRLQTRSYENQQGQRVFVTEVFVATFNLLESKAVSEQRQSTSGSQPGNQADGVATPPPHPSNDASVLPGSGIDIPDEDLPF